MLKKTIAFIFVIFSCSATQATVVEIQTVLGNVQVNLFDQKTPKTVQNFLEYVNSGAYANNAVHRSVPEFIVQAGGFQYDSTDLLVAVPQGTPVENEPVLSNVRGTIAMAKLGGDPNSATSQWFINLNDNSANLDVQNGGFTVFGQVLGDGMDIIDSIAALPQFNLGGAASQMPLINFTADDANDGKDVTVDNMVLITDVVIIDAEQNTNPDLNPVPNTLINSGNNIEPSSGSSGGSLPLLGLLAAIVMICVRRVKLRR